MTLLGLGGFPASHPLNLGMMGMHGEAWVNTGHPGGRPAHRARHALRRPRHRQPQDLRAATPRRSTSSIDPAEINKNVKVDVGAGRRRRARSLAAAAAARGRARPQRLAGAHRPTSKGDAAVRDIQNLPDNGHLYAAHVIHDLWRITEGKAHRRHRRGPAPDVGSAVLQARSPAHAHHLGRPRHDGLRAAGGDRRQGGACPTPRSGWSSATAASR